MRPGRSSKRLAEISYVRADSGKVLEPANNSGPVSITRNGEAAAVFMGIGTMKSSMKACVAEDSAVTAVPAGGCKVRFCRDGACCLRYNGASLYSPSGISGSWASRS